MPNVVVAKTSDSKGRDQAVQIQLPLHAPLFVKIAPDLSPDELTEVVLATVVDGRFVSNTMNARMPVVAGIAIKEQCGGDSSAPHTG